MTCSAVNIPQHVINTQLYLCLHPQASPALQRKAGELKPGREGRKEQWERKFCSNGSSAAAVPSTEFCPPDVGQGRTPCFITFSWQIHKVVRFSYTCAWHVKTYCGALGLLALLKG